MNGFRLPVSQAQAPEFIVRVGAGASSPKAREWGVPENIRLIRLPGSAPELNPEEHLGDEVREKAFSNPVLDRRDLGGRG